LWLLRAGDLICFNTTKILILKATVYRPTWIGPAGDPNHNQTLHVPEQTNTRDGNYQSKIYTVPKLRALTKLFKTYATSEALIMVIRIIPVLERAL